MVGKPIQIAYTVRDFTTKDGKGVNLWLDAVPLSSRIALRQAGIRS